MRQMLSSKRSVIGKSIISASDHTQHGHYTWAERAFGDVHDLCTRNHPRKRLRDLVADVEAHVHVNGPWPYKLSEIYYEPAVTAAVENMAAEEPSTAAAWVYQSYVVRFRAG
jgi:hypothetical protein